MKQTMKQRWDDMDAQQRVQFQKDWFIGRGLCFLGAWMAMGVQWGNIACGFWAIGSLLCLALCFGFITVFMVNEVEQAAAFAEGEGFTRFLDLWVENTLWLGGLTLMTFCVIRLTAMVS